MAERSHDIPPHMASPEIGDVTMQGASSHESDRARIRGHAALGGVLGLFGLVSLPWGLLSFYPGTLNTSWQSWSGSDVWRLATILTGTALSLLLIVASVGCYRFQRWGRLAMLLYGVSSIALGSASVYSVAAFVGLIDDTPTRRGFGACLPLVALPVGLLFGAYSIWFLSRPRTRAIFSGSAPLGHVP